MRKTFNHHKATVLFFWGRKCPCVKRYQARIRNIAARYEPFGLAFAYVAGNRSDTEEIIVKVSQAGSAQSTPTAIIFDKNGNVIFMVWVDNERDFHESNRKPYLKNALEKIIHDQEVSEPTSPMFGYPITQ